MVHILLFAALCTTSTDDLLRFQFLPSRPVSSYRLKFEINEAHRWSGRMRIYAWKGDWYSIKARTRKELRSRFADVEELPGDSAMLYFFGSANVRFAWGYGDTVGLYRDFRMVPQRINDLYPSISEVKGRRAKGWISALVYQDDERPK